LCCTGAEASLPAEGRNFECFEFGWLPDYGCDLGELIRAIPSTPTRWNFQALVSAVETAFSEIQHTVERRGTNAANARMELKRPIGTSPLEEKL
jgi:hypothetical protein